MLTDHDIKKLKKIFATKDDLKRFATKDDLKKFATKDDLKRFATKDDLKRFATKDDLKIYATKKDLEQMVERIVSDITEIIGTLGEKIDKALSELRSHRIVLGDHEERIQEIEKRIFPRI